MRLQLRQEQLQTTARESGTKKKAKEIDPQIAQIAQI
jgi:hypothetical protein